MEVGTWDTRTFCVEALAKLRAGAQGGLGGNHGVGRHCSSGILPVATRSRPWLRAWNPLAGRKRGSERALTDCERAHIVPWILFR
jgi:hypothetical protein